MSDHTTRILQDSAVPGEGVAVEGASLVLIYGAELGRRFPLLGVVDIGRALSNGVVIDADSVSRRHARVWPEDGGHWVEDLESTNGTMVNGERIDGAHRLQHGDLIKVGGVVLRFLCGDDLESRYHEEIYRLTIVDGLTQVHNRRYFDDFLEREVARCSRSGGALALILFDVDHFKSINDRLGHLFGDRMLRMLAARVQERVRREQLLARFGGDEFGIILPDVELEEAQAFGERLRELAARLVVRDRERESTVSLSLGVASLAAGMGAEDLVKEADEALRAAKGAGRNRVMTGRCDAGASDDREAAGIVDDDATAPFDLIGGGRSRP